MHQPASEPRRSLYHAYRVHPVAPLPAADTVAPVVVVGGGPIGLVTALGLAQQGVRCVLIEAERQACEGSRAIVFTRRTMEILQQAGVADAVLQRALPWRHGTSFYRGQPVFRLEGPHDDDERFFPMNNLQQQVLEEILADAAGRQPAIELRWGHKVVALVRNAELAELEIDTPHGFYRQRAQWVVGADGARSVLRGFCGLKMEGTAYEGRFVIADIRIELPLPTERLAFFDPPWNPGNTVLMHREPGGIWRFDYQLPAGETPEQALDPISLRTRIDAQLASIGHGGRPWELDWCSVYSARAMTLPDYVHRRVIFAGDAAHLLPIFGVRGANTGFQDAQNLAWKLGLAVRGNAGPGLLPSYSSERVGAAREVIGEAGKSTRFMAPPTAGYRLLRDAVLSLSLTQAFVRPLFHWRTARAHDHRDSPLNAAGDDDALFGFAPGRGAPLPNLRLDDGSHLLDHTCGEAAGCFVLIVFDAQVAGALGARLAHWRQRGVPVVLRLLDGRARQRLAGGHARAAYLLRPDQHVCARWVAAAPDRIEAALRQALGHG
jgi:3-(3-hydroxy-phenyl)propionate hydroxylase